MSKVISRVIIGVTHFRVLITLLITYLLSPLALQVGYWTSKGFLQDKDNSDTKLDWTDEACGLRA